MKDETKTTEKEVKENKLKVWWDDHKEDIGKGALKIAGGVLVIAGGTYALYKWGSKTHERFVNESIDKMKGKLIDMGVKPDLPVEAIGDTSKTFDYLRDKICEEKGVEDFMERTKATLDEIAAEAKAKDLDVVISFGVGPTDEYDCREIDVYMDNISLNCETNTSDPEDVVCG
jgi:hypothetical protein